MAVAAATLTAPPASQQPRSPSPYPALRGNWRAVTPFDECRAGLHRLPFRLKHDLTGHPLFGIDALLRVASAAAKRSGDVYLDAGKAMINTKWGEMPGPDMPIEEIIRHIEHNDAWIVMKHIEVDPAYAEILNEWADFMREIAGDKAHLLLKPEMLVFITSPNRITPFHFDAEVGMLVQIQGSKTLWICDPEDRSVVKETELEHYYAVSIAAGNYTPYAETVATRIDLSPGDAAHIPGHAGHWVRNGNGISVSLSLNFELPRRLRRDVYVANHHIRRLGLTPRPPGQSAAADRAKALAVAAARQAKRAMRGAVRR